MLSIQSAIVKIILAVLLFIGVGATGYYVGSSHQKTVYVTQQNKANDAVIKKNDQMQAVADKESAVQIVYKDRIVTKYQTITKEAVQYEKTPAANNVLDSEFVRLHDTAATDSTVQATGPAEGTDGSDQTATSTTGEAISVIADNYKSFYECKAEVEGWQRFYTEMQKQVNQ